MEAEFTLLEEDIFHHPLCTFLHLYLTHALLPLDSSSASWRPALPPSLDTLPGVVYFLVLILLLMKGNMWERIHRTLLIFFILCSHQVMEARLNYTYHHPLQVSIQALAVGKIFLAIPFCMHTSTDIPQVIHSRTT